MQLGTNLLWLYRILSQPTGVCYCRTGTRGSVEERVRAREERSRERALPAARAFTSQSSSVQTLEEKQGGRGRLGAGAGLGCEWPSPTPGPHPTDPGQPQLTFIVDLAVPVNVGLSDHLIHFLVCQLLTQVRHDVAQLRSADVAVAILVCGDRDRL